MLLAFKLQMFVSTRINIIQVAIKVARKEAIILQKEHSVHQAEIRKEEWNWEGMPWQSNGKSKERDKQC